MGENELGENESVLSDTHLSSKKSVQSLPQCGPPKLSKAMGYPQILSCNTC